MAGGPRRYVLTGDGIRIAVFYTKVYNRLLVLLTAANQPQVHPRYGPVAAITRHVDDYATCAPCPTPPENMTQTSTSPRPKIARICPSFQPMFNEQVPTKPCLPVRLGHLLREG